ncbi:hypothetical protein [Mycobacterium sp.]|uniref:hypothetical protein n=1 Tax=Mycobacterium sp. TaxID=1785 RepID=UPI003F94C1C5
MERTKWAPRGPSGCALERICAAACSALRDRSFTIAGRLTDQMAMTPTRKILFRLTAGGVS